MARADCDAEFRQIQHSINERLALLLPPEDEPPPSLHGAMRYATLGGGKRLRAALCLAGHRLFGNPNPEAAREAGCAIECLHAYSLIHDDLPSLDDDDFRRGQPACHRRYGEAVAILAGDALQALAFDILSRCRVPAEHAVEAVRILSRTAGSRYLVGGQVADLEGEHTVSSGELVRFIHSRKTAELIAASLSIGAALAGAPDKARIEIHEAGRKAGFAFQIVDDLLDLEGSEEKVGKPLRKDEERRKITYPAQYGAEVSRAEARRLIADATNAALKHGDEGFIGYLFSLIVERAS